jgi:hypothetical protein
VLAHRQRVERVVSHRMQYAAGLFGALGGVLGQVARDLATLLGVERPDVEL